MARRLGAWAGLCAALLLASSVTVGPANANVGRCRGHRVVDLGTLGGSFSFATDVNDSRVVVGASATSDPNVTQQAFVWTERAGMRNLGTLGGPNSQAQAVNNRGEIAGYSDTGVGGHRAFYWSERAGMLEVSGYDAEDSATTTPYAINDKGRIVGVSVVGSSPRAFTWTRGKGFVDIAPGVAYAVNSRGVVTGAAETAGGLVPFLWSEDRGITFVALPPGAEGVGMDINDSNQITGYFTDGSAYRAFIWSRRDGLFDLGTLGGPRSMGVRISEDGTLAGIAEVSDPSESWHGFVRRPGSDALQDIGSLGGRYTEIQDQNDRGQVVGTSSKNDGTNVAFIWDRQNGISSLGTLGGPNSYAYSINSSGDAVGEANLADALTHAALWRRNSSRCAGN